jgi:hypothetical protein
MSGSGLRGQGSSQPAGRSLEGVSLATHFFGVQKVSNEDPAERDLGSDDQKTQIGHSKEIKG